MPKQSFKRRTKLEDWTSWLKNFYKAIIDKMWVIVYSWQNAIFSHLLLDIQGGERVSVFFKHPVFSCLGLSSRTVIDWIVSLNRYTDTVNNGAMNETFLDMALLQM